MANLQVRDIDDRLYSSLKALARKENRSVSQEVVSILERHLANPLVYRDNPTKKFLELSGAWDDERSANEIINELKKSRRVSSRFGDKDVFSD
jgi:hypothetical protein